LDPSAYKLATSQPDAFRSSELIAISNILKESDQQLSISFDSTARRLIPKPDLHNGSISDDFYRISLSLNLAFDIAAALFNAEASTVSLEGHTTTKASQIAALLDRWTAFSESLSQ
jgi:hypothetical protein